MFRSGCAHRRNFAERFAGVGVPVIPAGPSLREAVSGPKAWQAKDLPTRAAELVAAQYDAVVAAAQGCDVLVATGLYPAIAHERLE